VSVLLYHLVCVAKYRRIIFDQQVDQELKNVCLDLSQRYEIHFLEIGTDQDHVHFLIQSVPMYSPTKIVKTIKSIVAREMFLRVPQIKQKLWGGEFWTDGYFVNTAGKHNTESAIKQYIKNQGGEIKNYIPIHKAQLRLF